MIHIVFQQSDIDKLSKAIELDESISGEIFQIKDDFAVGPLEGIDSETGWHNRLMWWSQLMQYSPYSNDLTGSFDDRKTVENIQDRLKNEPDQILWIWMGQNQHDVCGYYWLISRLKDFQGRIFILYLNNLPFINEKGQLFYPASIHEIPPKEFLKAKKLNRKITLSEFEVDPDEWKRLCMENSLIRILEGGKKIAGQNVEYYDDDIIRGLTAEWQKGNRAMTSILSKMKIKTGDIFLLWRMKMMSEEGRIEINGDPSKGWKEFDVRLKVSATEEVEDISQ